jgi:hypothetical protein
MNPTKELKQDMSSSVDRLRALRDDVRVRLHLAGMDAKDEWNKLEPRVAELERRVLGELNDASRAAIEDVIKRLSRLRDKMRSA